MVSEPTLYRYDAINGHPEDIEVAVRRSDGTLVGLFVQVEPDHDSAIIALLSPATVKAIGVSMSYNQAKKIVQVVLVGAGIGSDDD